VSAGLPLCTGPPWGISWRLARGEVQRGSESNSKDIRPLHSRPLPRRVNPANLRRSVLAYVVVGDPKKGLVGLGRGRGKAPAKAVEAAFYNGMLRSHSRIRYKALLLRADMQPSCKWTP